MIVASKRRDVEQSRIRPLNARSLALSVLLGTHPPELPARALVSLAELFGIGPGTMRTALSRMVAAGEVATDAGRYRLSGRLLDRQQSQDTGRAPPIEGWDGAWHTVVVVADQRDLAERRRFRARMLDHRMGELRPEVWMRPSNTPAPPHGPSWLVTTGPLTTDTGLTERLWDLGTVAAAGHTLLDDLDRLRADTDWDDPASIPELFVASAAVVRYLRAEPRLPPVLTPPDWPADELRARYDRFEADHQRLLQRFLRSAGR